MLLLGSAAPVSQPAHTVLPGQGREPDHQPHQQDLHIPLHILHQQDLHILLHIFPAELPHHHQEGGRLQEVGKEKVEEYPTLDPRAPGATQGNPGPPRGLCLGCAWGRGTKGDPRGRESSPRAGHRQGALGAHQVHHHGRLARGGEGGEEVDHDRHDFLLFYAKDFYTVLELVLFF